MDNRRIQIAGDIKRPYLSLEKNPCQLYSTKEFASETVFPKTLEEKCQNCTCTVPRSLIQWKEKSKLQMHQKLSKESQRTKKVTKLVLNCRLSKNKSLNYCFLFFTTWILLFSPILNDILGHTLPDGYQLSLGGAVVVQGCHPSRVPGPSRPRPSVNLSPFRRNEYVPKVSEQTIGASGPAEGPIYRDTTRYRDELVPNWNPDIVFRDDEQTNEDRMMTKLCMSRLNELAIWVMNHWPGVKLRVTDGWDDPSSAVPFSERALHYEGRAVDITTSDQDRSKYPILARLAVEAGFDWVLYKTAFVHCSVKSHSMAESRGKGCFPGESHVRIPGGGSIRMDELMPGTPVLSVDSNGKVITDTVLTFMDVRSDVYFGKQASRRFVSITTETGHNLQLTRNHLIYTSKIKSGGDSINNSSLSVRSSPAIFAGNVEVGDYVFVANLTYTATVRPIKVINVDHVVMTSGAYAPLTSQGTILVDGTMASCYAVIENDFLAHFAMTPVRVFYELQYWFNSEHDWTKSSMTQRNTTAQYGCHLTSDLNSEGILTYANFLYKIAYKIIPEPWIWGD